MSTDTINRAHFTADQVMEALEAVVEGHEDYVDPRARSLGMVCKYIVDGVPSCIVGQVLARLGVSEETLEDMDNCMDPMIGAVAVKVLNENGVTLEPRALQVLIVAQSEQDGCHPWSTALREARLTYGRTSA